MRRITRALGLTTSVTLATISVATPAAAERAPSFENSSHHTSDSSRHTERITFEQPESDSIVPLLVATPLIVGGLIACVVADERHKQRPDDPPQV
jgi:hypothetical protein